MTDIISPRRSLAELIARHINEQHLCSPYGGDVDKRTSPKGRPYYSILFSTPRNLDGGISVYGEKFIEVKFVTRYHHLPHNGRFVFTSVQDVLDFIKAGFVDFDESKANMILGRAKS